MINILPKKSLPNAKTLGSIAFSKCLEITFSKLQNNVAIKTDNAPSPYSKFVIRKSKKFPPRRKTAGMNTFLFNLSLRNNVAKIATKINIVLWIKLPTAPFVICSPLKNNTKGMEPPTNPTNTNEDHCLLLNLLRLSNSLKPRIIAKRNIATIRFFVNVNSVESIPLTPNLLMNIENPEITAVNNMKIIPLFFIKKYK